MDPSALAAFLAPCLGFLLGSGKAVADAASERLGEQVWGYATRLWDKLRPEVEAEVAQQAAERPDDEASRVALAGELERALESDPELAAAVEQVWAEANRAGAVVAGERGIAIGGSVSDSTIVTGDQNTLRGG